jgi:hypothetical protein
MPGDPKECRQRARRCAELAADLDNAQTLIVALDETDSGPPIKAAE